VDKIALMHRNFYESQLDQRSVRIGNVKISTVKGDQCAKISKMDPLSARCTVTFDTLRRIEA